MKTRTYYIYFILIHVFYCTNSFCNVQIDTLEIELEKTMSKRAEFDKVKEDNIKKLSSLLEDTKITLENKYFIINKIIDEYQYYSFDSALFYIEQNLENAHLLKNEFSTIETKLKLAILLAESGLYKESIDVVNEIDRKTIPTKLLINYYACLKEGYSGLSYYTVVKKYKENYSYFYQSYKDSLSNLLDVNSEDYLRLQEKSLRDQRKLDEAFIINDQRLKTLKMGSRLFSIVTFERSLLYELKKEISSQKKYLILSAQSDIMSSVKDNASMTDLAMLLFKQNEVEKAHNYINFSVADAEFYNSRLRFVNISNILSVITKAYDAETESQKNKLTNFLIILTLLGVVLYPPEQLHL